MCGRGVPEGTGENLPECPARKRRRSALIQEGTGSSAGTLCTGVWAVRWERTEEWMDEMDEMTTTHRRGVRRNVWVNSLVVLLLLTGALLGITQMFILLAVYALVIAPA